MRSLGRPSLFAMAILIAATAASPLRGQGLFGVDGLVSERAENAFGVGVTLAYPLFVVPVGQTWVSAKVMGFGDLEIVTGTRLLNGICRRPDTTPGRFYYRDCNTGDTYPPELVEASSPMRIFTGGYLLVDAWRIRLGGGVTLHPGGGDAAFTPLVGFAASRSSWLMLESPGWVGWRLRIQITLAGPDFIW